MKQRRSVLLAGSILIGSMSPAFGAAGALTPAVTVTPLQSNVTYAETAPILNTYAGFAVTGFANTGGNTINNIVVKFEATVTDPSEKLALHLPDFYLGQLPNCSWPTAAANTVTFTCSVKQLKAGGSFPAFTAFYKVPSKGTGTAADYISVKHTIQYAEGTNDCSNGCANSILETVLPNQVLLGTVNPVDVRSGVPRNGGKLFTGTGVPKNEPNKKFTEEVLVPDLAQVPSPVAYALSTLGISWVSSTDTSIVDPCGSLGNFIECPNYATKVLEPKVNPTDPDIPVAFSQANPLRITYRMDGANVKRPEAQLRNAVLLEYVADGSATAVPVPMTCTNNQASLDGIPCVLSFKCYKQNEKTPDLAKDCEFVTLGLRNGLLRIR